MEWSKGDQLNRISIKRYMEQILVTSENIAELLKMVSNLWVTMLIGSFSFWLSYCVGSWLKVYCRDIFPASEARQHFKNLPGSLYKLPLETHVVQYFRLFGMQSTFIEQYFFRWSVSWLFGRMTDWSGS